MNDIQNLLCQASDNQLDESMFPLIEKWDDPPKALQILEVLDRCAYGGLASEFAMMALHAIFESACTREGSTRKEIQELAIWRKDLR